MSDIAGSYRQSARADPDISAVPYRI